MKCLEITPKEYVTYEMPDYLKGAMKRAFAHRLCKSIRSFVAMMPDDIKELVTVTKKLRPPVTRGREVNWVFYDELATPEEIQRALEYERRMAATRSGDSWVAKTWRNGA